MKNLSKIILFFFLMILISCRENEIPEFIPQPPEPLPEEVGTYQGILTKRGTVAELDSNFLPVVMIWDTSYSHEVTVEVYNDSIFFINFSYKRIEFAYNNSDTIYSTYDVFSHDEMSISFKPNDTLYMSSSFFAGASGQEYTSGSTKFTGVKQ